MAEAPEYTADMIRYRIGSKPLASFRTGSAAADGMFSGPLPRHGPTPVKGRTASSVLSVLASAGFLVYLVYVFGWAPFTAAFEALTPWSASAALLCGLIGTAAQAARWRIVSGGYGMELSSGPAMVQCYQGSFLNSVLPGGLAGDAMRAARQRMAHSSTWSHSVGSVLGERLTQTVIVLLAAAAALLALDWRLCAAAAVAAGIVFAATRPALRRLSLRQNMALWGLSVAGWASFAALFTIAVVSTSPELEPLPALPLAALCLAGMSIPFNVGGWGPREGISALAFLAYGYGGAEGVAASAGYGLLALISVTPGAALLLVLAWRRRPPSQISAHSAVT